MNSDSLNMVSRLGEGHMPCNLFLSEPQLKTTVSYRQSWQLFRLVILTGTLIGIFEVFLMPVAFPIGMPTRSFENLNFIFSGKADSIRILQELEFFLEKQPPLP